MPHQTDGFEFVGGDVIGSLLCACHACEAGFGDRFEPLSDGVCRCVRSPANVPDLQLDALVSVHQDHN